MIFGMLAASQVLARELNLQVASSLSRIEYPSIYKTLNHLLNIKSPYAQCDAKYLAAAPICVHSDEWLFSIALSAVNCEPRVHII